MRVLSSFVGCFILCLPLLGAEDITIQNAKTDNPTLLYKGKPMLKTGPISEDRVFMYAIGSKFFDHKAWFDYMEKYGFGFGDIAVLVDPTLGSWEVADCPEVNWDLYYQFRKTKGKILRCYDVDRDGTFTLLEEKLRSHANK